MKLATLRDGTPDGRLIVLTHDGGRFALPPVLTMQAALEDWANVEPQLRLLASDAGASAGAQPLDTAALLAPLPRAWQWLDASAFASHGRLMEAAFNMAPIVSDGPLMYQGMSHRFLAPTEEARFAETSHGIDLEAELGVVTGFVAMGTSTAEARRSIRLIVLLNDWSLRALGATEMKTGFGWVGGKPACSAAPYALTPDELGSAWSADARIDLVVEAWIDGNRLGAVRSNEMEYDFGELIAHAARTRDLCAGTIIGSGTVSARNYAEVGSCCLAERRAIEVLRDGAASTPFLSDGSTVTIRAVLNGSYPFGTICQRVSTMA